MAGDSDAITALRSIGRHERIGSLRVTAASSQRFLWSGVGSVSLGVDHACDDRPAGCGGVGAERVAPVMAN
jgi:hypothetical protein